MLEESTPYEREHVLPNHLGKPTEFVIKFIPTGKSPRGVVFGPDGARAYVANALDDTVAVIDMQRLEEETRIDLGGSKTINQARYGEQVFHSANIAFRR